MNKQMVMSWMICMCLGCGAHAAQPAACPAIEMAAVADAPTDSTRTVALDDGKTLALTRTPVVTSADITGARASQDNGQWVLQFDLTDEAAKRVQDFSKQHVGQTVALLLDGKVRGTPKIVGPLTGKGFQIGVSDRAEGERLATAVGNGCKR